MVLLVLAVVWGLVLFSWLRSKTADGAFSDSVGTFRRHLRVLEQTTPVTIRPANRMRSGYVAGRPPTTPERTPPAMRRGAARHGRPALRPPSTAAIRRHASQRRRRNVLLLLMAVLGPIMLLVAMTKSIDALIALFVAVLALVAYIGLLVRRRNRVAEREKKLTYLSQVRREAAGRPPTTADRRPAASAPRRRAAPGYEAPDADAGGYEVAPGYGQLALRRVAT